MEEVIWIRILSHLVFVSVLFVPQYGLDILRSKRLKSQFMASAMLFLSTYLFFKSVSIIPLAEATAITFVGPLMVTVLAVPMLGEQTSLFRVICVVCGFMGALLVIRPGTVLHLWRKKEARFVRARVFCPRIQYGRWVAGGELEIF